MDECVGKVQLPEDGQALSLLNDDSPATHESSFARLKQRLWKEIHD